MKKGITIVTACIVGCVILIIAGCGTKEAPAPEAATSATESVVEIERVTTPTGIDMVRIPGGSFIMGSKLGEDDEKPVRTVTVKSFWMDVTEVTQKAYVTLRGKNPSKSKGDDKPVEQLSWHAATTYCNTRSAKEGLDNCYDPETKKCDYEANGYRLPTEAEWEYACRAGTTTAYSFGDGKRELEEHGWFKKNAGGAPRPVGGKKPNPWGLHDMHGNVWEWCGDHYADDYYAKGENADPRGPAVGGERVLRGGGYKSNEASCESSTRYSETPGLADVCFGYDAYGFRCVRRASETGK